MRPIAIVAGDFRRGGGMDAANFHLALHLAREGHEVHAIGYHVAEELARLPQVTVHAVPRPLGSYTLGRSFLDSVGRREAARAAGRGGRAVVNGGNCAFPDVNWVHYVHAAWRPRTEPRLLTRLKRGVQQQSALWSERRALPQARLVIANSERTRVDLLERLGIPPSRIRTVYCGVEPERFRPPTGEERQRARARLGLPSDVPVVAFVGALGDRRKGFDTVYAAWRELCRRAGFEAVLVVAGGGGELPRWRERAREDGLEDRVRLVGYVQDVPGLLWAANALLAPSRYEPFGVAVLEGLCCGLPAWVSREAGVAERYSVELAEFLLSDPEDAGGLAERIRGWYEAPARHERAARALSDTLRAHTWDEMARQLSACLEGEG
ncbi:MAG TPA: glycosyltransferase family 4 protein [Myxococcaceae bacterium]|nr:glycosyltransferase family 4 protein [Myxococcaceae bacterium]